MLNSRGRTALTRTVWTVLVVILIAAVAAEYELNVADSQAGSEEVDISIIEDNPVLQIDHFYPDRIDVPLGKNITLVIQNQDDETRVFTLSQFNVNVTMVSGTSQRVAFQANALGNFTFFSPKTPPSPVSQGRPGPCLQGLFDVTQNYSTLSSATSTTVAPGSTNCLTTP